MGPACSVAMLAQERHRFERVDAVSSAAIGDDLATLWNVANPTLELPHRHGQCAGDVACVELLGRADVQNRDIVLAHQAPQFLERHRFQLVVAVNAQANNLLDLSEPGVAERLERAEETKDIIIRQAVIHVSSIATRLDEARLPKDAQMRAGVLDRRRDLRGERFDGPLALTEQVEQLDPFGARERVPDARELRVESVLESSVAGNVPELRKKWS